MLFVAYFYLRDMIKPIKRQNPKTAINPREILPVIFITSITITVTNDIKAPTDKSTSPLVKRIVIPNATIMTVELERSIL